jgi:hypothetical protein
MNVYVYIAGLWCEDCALDVISRLNDTTEDNGDSDTFPQGPYSNGGGESDSPAHCDACFKFLENPLTSDGIEYVRETIAKHPQGEAAQEWAEFYKEIL